MSLATNQTLLLLAVVSGAFKVMLGHDLLCDKTKHTAAYGQDVCERIIHDYPATGDEKKNLLWMHRHLKTWSEMIDETHKVWTPLVLTTMSLNILEDLMVTIKRSDILRQLDDLRAPLIGLSGVLVDQVGDEFVSFAEADEYLEKMYKLIEFGG